LWGTIVNDAFALEKEIAPFSHGNNRIESFLVSKKSLKLETSNKLFQEIDKQNKENAVQIKNKGEPEY
jgi:hypothetical protein